MLLCATIGRKPRGYRNTPQLGIRPTSFKMKGLGGLTLLRAENAVESLFYPATSNIKPRSIGTIRTDICAKVIPDRIGNVCFITDMINLAGKARPREPNRGVEYPHGSI